MDPLKNWRTSLAGILAGSAHLLTCGTDAPHILAAVALAAIGVYAQDAPRTAAQPPASSRLAEGYTQFGGLEPSK